MDAEIISTVFEVATRTKMTGAIIARGVRYEDFLRDYSGQHVEWVQGHVIKISPVSAEHNAITRFLIVLFDNLLSEVGGQVFHDPMVMRLGPEQPRVSQIFKCCWRTICIASTGTASKGQPT